MLRGLCTQDGVCAVEGLLRGVCVLRMGYAQENSLIYLLLASHKLGILCGWPTIHLFFAIARTYGVRSWKKIFHCYNHTFFKYAYRDERFRGTTLFMIYIITLRSQSTSDSVTWVHVSAYSKTLSRYAQQWILHISFIIGSHLTQLSVND